MSGKDTENGGFISGKAVQIDQGQAIVIPSDLLERAGIAMGDQVDIVPVDGGLALFPHGSPAARALAATLDSMDRHADVYRRLAE